MTTDEWFTAFLALYGFLVVTGVASAVALLMLADETWGAMCEYLQLEEKCLQLEGDSNERFTV